MMEEKKKLSHVSSSNGSDVLRIKTSSLKKKNYLHYQGQLCFVIKGKIIVPGSNP